MTWLVFWIAVGVLSLIIEITTGTFYLLVVALSALFPSLIAGFFPHLTVAWQLASFALSLTLGFIFLRFKKPPEHPELQQLQDPDIGFKVSILQSNPDGSYRVQHRGTQWNATVPDAPATLIPGTIVQITAVQGVTLICKRLD